MTILKGLPPATPMQDIVALEVRVVKIGDRYVALHLFGLTKTILRAQVLVTRGRRFWREIDVDSLIVERAARKERLKITRIKSCA